MSDEDEDMSALDNMLAVIDSSLDIHQDTNVDLDGFSDLDNLDDLLNSPLDDSPTAAVGGFSSDQEEMEAFDHLELEDGKGLDTAVSLTKKIDEDDPWLDSASVQHSQASVDSMSASMHRQLSKKNYRGSSRTRRAESQCSSTSSPKSHGSPNHFRSAFRKQKTMLRIQNERERDETFRPKTTDYQFRSKRYDFITEMEIDQKRRKVRAEKLLMDKEIELGRLFTPKISKHTNKFFSNTQDSKAHERLYAGFKDKRETEVRLLREAEQRKLAAEKRKSGISPRVQTKSRHMYSKAQAQMRKLEAARRAALKQESLKREAVKIRKKSLQYLANKLKRDLRYAFEEVHAEEPSSATLDEPNASLDYKQVVNVMTKLGFFVEQKSSGTEELNKVEQKQMKMKETFFAFLDSDSTGRIKFNQLEKFLGDFVVHYSMLKKISHISKLGKTPAEAHIKKLRGTFTALKKELHLMMVNYTSNARCVKRWNKQQEEFEVKHGLAIKKFEPQKAKKAPKKHIEQNATRLYNLQAQQQIKKSILAKTFEARELAECTFQPKVLDKSRDRGISIITGQNAHSRLHEQHYVQQKKNEMLKQRYKRKEDEQFKSQCTFQPKLSKQRNFDSTPVVSPKAVADTVQRLRAVHIDQGTLETRKSRTMPKRQYANPTYAKKDTKKNSNPQHNSEVLFYLDVQISPEHSDRIAVRKGDSLTQVARNFAKKHRLQPSYVPLLKQTLEAQVSSVMEAQVSSVMKKDSEDTSEILVNELDEPSEFDEGLLDLPAQLEPT